MTRPASTSTALVVGGVTALVFAAGIPLAAIAHRPGKFLIVVFVVPFAAVGVLVARRQPRNAIGWILIALAAGSAVGSEAGFYAIRAYSVDHHGVPLSRLAAALAPLAWISILLLLPLPI